VTDIQGCSGGSDPPRKHCPLELTRGDIQRNNPGRTVFLKMHKDLVVPSESSIQDRTSQVTESLGVAPGQ